MATKKVTKSAAAKTAEVKAEDAKKAETKTIETKAKTTASAAKKEEPKAVEVKKAEKKPAAKKAAKTAKKPAAKKEMKVNAFVEYHGKKVEEKTIIADVKKAWTKSGGKVGEIKTMDLYIKPEEDAVYYVINGTETGSVVF